MRRGTLARYTLGIGHLLLAPVVAVALYLLIGLGLGVLGLLQGAGGLKYAIAYMWYPGVLFAGIAQAPSYVIAAASIIAGIGVLRGWRWARRLSFTLLCMVLLAGLSASAWDLAALYRNPHWLEGLHPREPFGLLPFGLEFVIGLFLPGVVVSSIGLGLLWASRVQRRPPS